MTLFHTSIKNVLQEITDSNYPFQTVDYSDEVVAELHLRIPPPGLIEVAMHGKEFINKIKESNIVSLDKIICIESVNIRDEYRNSGYMTALLNSLEVNFSAHHLCITNVNNERFAQWIAKRRGWKGVSYLHPFSISSKSSNTDEFNKQLMKQNFVNLAVSDDA